MWYFVTCLDCDADPTAFSSDDERGEWILAHRTDTGHQLQMTEDHQ